MLTPAQIRAGILGQQPGPVATVNAPTVNGYPISPMVPTPGPQLPRQNPMADILLQRGNRETPIHTGIGLLGRLAALGVGTKLQRQGAQERQDAALKAIEGLDPDLAPIARMALLTGADPSNLLTAITTTRGQNLTKEQQEKERAFKIEEGQRERSATEKLWQDRIASSERIAEADRAIAQERNDIARIEADLSSKAAGVKGAGELMDDFRAESKDIKIQAAAFRRIQAAAEEPSGAGDLALIFSFMKVLDPQSTVREGEFANAQNTGSVPQRVWSIYNSIIEGKRLSPTQREDFVKRSGKLFAKARDSHVDLEDEFLGIAGKRGVDPEQFLVDYLGDLRDFEPGTYQQPAGADGMTDQQREAARAQGLIP